MSTDDKLRRIIETNTSARYRRLDALEAVAEGRQYDGRPSWWESDVPAWERRPCIRYGIIADAIRDNTALLAGESRFPCVELAGDETGAIDAIFRAARFRSHFRSQLRHAQACGTMVGFFGVRNGKLFAESTRAKWCTPVFAADGALESITIQYPYTAETPAAHGKPCKIVRLFRRVIDRETDTVWDAVAKDDGSEPSWQQVGEVVTHGFGFCPAIWAPFRRECSTHNEIDGVPIHDDAVTDMLHALDIAVSQRHRAALYLEPQWTEVGVQPGYVPTESGRAAAIPASVHGGRAAPGSPVTAFYTAPSVGGKARKKGPGYVWQYDDPAVKVELHQANAGALGALTEHAADLENKLAQALSVVFLDPARLKFAVSLSGRALKLMRQRQLDMIDEIRDDVAETYLIPAAKMLQAIVLATGKVRGLTPEQLSACRSDSEITVTWASYMDSDPAEEETITRTAAQAVTAGIISRETAASKVSRVFGIESASDEMARIQADDDRKADIAGKLIASEASSYHAAAYTDRE